MSRRRRAKVAKGAKHRNRIWAVGITLVIIIVAVSVVVSRGSEGVSSVIPNTSETPGIGEDSPVVPGIYEIPRISAEEVKQKLDAGSNIVIVDARSSVAYEQLHIAGAISIPLGEISERYSELSPYDEIITYCT